ncbi:dGTP triphosphohydrolase [Bythopirellula polymerisocia]|uniref:Deoxyguanosinetriphosphate triphosphohydrolase-like protein n=1 Tax=Bythopirellula polymerisocia TaxID=2528003 RepID=A0A5C6CX82_9BACT|nr:dNTP triphosphohydrolase [Bythopirellula polymerisocia]TWU28187.1 Deoxyguanosinetriphosphate triphosphohydrolase [Bythopirellula polymerisocia]
MDREQALLAPYAMHSEKSAGREHPEPPHPYRGPFQRDRDRIVHSSAFRRLAHKTQVFTGELGDYHRSRLTHTLEVASIARTIGRVLRLNEDLIEALALMHDIGHPPFGHAGEKILDECCRDCGGFNHNRHALRIVTLLENRYPEFAGLNLTEEVLSGQQVRAEKHTASASAQPLLEVQVVDAADSIAYDTHDADDALELSLLDFDDLLSVPLWKEAAQQVRLRYANLEPEAFRRTVIHHLIETLVSDLVESTRDRLSNVASLDDALNYGTSLVAPSSEVAAKKSELESFLFERVYRHPTVLAERAIAADAVRALFAKYRQDPDQLPARFHSRLPQDGESRSVCDYLASMTDRFALSRFRGR